MTILDIARMMFALLFVLGLIGGCALLARRFGVAEQIKSAGAPGRRQKRLRLIETMALDRTQRIAIIQCDERQHLISMGPNGVRLLQQSLPEPLSDGCAKTETATAAAVFGSALNLSTSEAVLAADGQKEPDTDIDHSLAPGRRAA